jgi:hypothetical protein
MLIRGIGLTGTVGSFGIVCPRSLLLTSVSFQVAAMAFIGDSTPIGLQLKLTSYEESVESYVPFHVRRFSFFAMIVEDDGSAIDDVNNRLGNLREHEQKQMVSEDDRSAKHYDRDGQLAGQPELVFLHNNLTRGQSFLRWHSHDSIKTILSRPRPERDEQNRFSFRSKDEVICNDALDSPFDTIDMLESDDQGVSGGSSGVSQLAEVCPSTKPAWTRKNAEHAEGEGCEARIDEDEVLAKVNPILKKRIKDALEPLHGTVASALQRQRRIEREVVLALQEKKLALKRQNIQRLKQRRGFQPTGRASAVKSSRLKLRKRAVSSAVRLRRRNHDIGYRAA